MDEDHDTCLECTVEQTQWHGSLCDQVHLRKEMCKIKNEFHGASNMHTWPPLISRNRW